MPSYVSIYAMTFNLAGNIVDDGIFSYIPLRYDLYILGFQEVGPFVSISAMKNQSRLSSVLQKHFGPKFRIICDKELVAIKLFILINDEYNKTTPCQVDATYAISTGADGAYGNKGAVACSMLVKNTKILSICAHFAAHEKHIAERNQNYANIMNEIQIQSHSNPLESHHFIIFVGDLNYRIQSTYNAVTQMATAGRFRELLENDQLTIEKRAMRVFSGFCEGEISFPPTYRFNKQSLVYDTSKKMRVPSYTDRILIYAQDQRSFEMNEYNANMDILLSDHRPVIATLRFSLWHDDENRPIIIPKNFKPDQKSSIVCYVI